jgi:Ca2+/Na+ antiporter|tara:strand:- start:268 stop:528 length:261 start_codon:yes stop_codon:yes gene_type:complete
MSTAYALLLGLVVFLILFIYFVFFSVSLRLEKNENEAEIAVKRKSVPFKWKDLIDPKNKKLGLIDLGNHVLIAGIVLIGIFIISNA